MIHDKQELRTLYDDPKRRSMGKERSEVDVHCARFIGLSPFCVLSTVKASGTPGVSPRGGQPGFVRIADQHTLVLADSIGNNRVDTLSNVAANHTVAMLFFIPDVEETLRVYGDAEVVAAELYAAEFAEERNQPKTVLRVTVRPPSCTAPRR